MGTKGLVTTQYLSDIASAIRQRGAWIGTYQPSQMASAILSIPHDTAQLMSLTATVNSVYTPTTGYDGFSIVTVSVPSSILSAVTFSQNSVYTPATGYDGFSQVTVSVSATQTIGYDIECTDNGDGTQNMSIFNGHLIQTAEIVITSNGVYTVPEGIDGYSKITVIVE